MMWRCPRCGRAFAARGATHACNSQRPEDLMAPFEGAVAVHGAVRTFLESLGPVVAEATRTQAAFRTTRRFAYIWAPALSLKGGARDLVLSFDLGRRVHNPRIRESYEARAGLWVHHVPVRSPRDLDSQVRAWLQEAYQYSRRPRRARAAG